MLFNSLTFVIFFLVTFFIYYLPYCRHIQVLILVVASLIFYAWSSPWLLVLLLLSILINGVVSFKVANAGKPKQLFWAILGIAVNLSILGLFKYGALLNNFFTNIFQASNRAEEGIIHLLLQLPLPIGISFYTFEGISLLVDVLHNQDKTLAEGGRKKSFYSNSSLSNHLLNTSFFISFFPHLIAGPILKANNFYPQIEPKYLRDISWGIVFRTLVVGYFLKMVVADNLKDYTFWISFPHYQGFGTVTNLVFLFGYSIQIFADFAGYSLIAIGLAKALGYTLPENFDFPYISCSISEFWRRWHISLSTWLRDYLYFPLGGNRKGKMRTYVNLMIVMTLGGLWHGAAWSYAVWGIFHGVGLAAERFLGLNEQSNKAQQQSKPIWQQFLLDLIRVLGVFSFVSIGWLLFKLPNFGQAVDFLVTLGKNIGFPLSIIKILPILVFSLPVIIYHIPYFPTFHNYRANRLNQTKSNVWRICRNLTLGLMLALIFLNSGSSNEFIYFQF